MAVCQPIRYKDVTLGRILIVLGIIYILNVFFVWPLGLLCKMDGDKCVAGYTISGDLGITIGKVRFLSFQVKYFVSNY